MFGKLWGERKTAIRGGFGLLYDRSNLVQNVLIPMLGVGFGQTISVNGPLCNASGAAGPVCVGGCFSTASAVSFAGAGRRTLPATVSPPRRACHAPRMLGHTHSHKLPALPHSRKQQ